MSYIYIYIDYIHIYIHIHILYICIYIHKDYSYGGKSEAAEMLRPFAVLIESSEQLNTFTKTNI